MTRHETSEGGERIRFRTPSRRLFAACFLLTIVGLVASMGMAFLTEGGLERFSFAYLTNFAYFLSLGLGALFFVLIQHVTKAGWSVAVRRVAEIIAATLPILAAAFAPIAVAVVAGDGALYPWARSHAALEETAHAATSEVHAPSVATAPDHGGENKRQAGGIDPHLEAELIQKKGAWLNAPFFLVRCVVYLGVWSFLGLWLFSRSRRQDESKEIAVTRGLQRMSPLALIAYAFTVTFAAFDLLLSLSPAFVSTIFGVYYFSGAVVGGVAFLILALLGLQAMGFVRSSVTVEHFHDLGKLLFGFVFFWGYIAFCQYMLIWYANLPESTFWLSARGATSVTADATGWSGVTLLLLFGKFILPFLGLLSRHVKRSRAALGFFAVWLLVFHWIDLYWVVLPELMPDPHVGLPEILTFLGLLGLFVGSAVRIAAENCLVPVGDPRLSESLAFHNL
jgi:hypothetical protein